MMSLILHMRVRHLRLADAVHDEQPGIVLGAELRVERVRQAADVIDEVPAMRQHLRDDIAAPGVDGKQRCVEASLSSGHFARKGSRRSISSAR
jgi:hypothetical protein